MVRLQCPHLALAAPAPQLSSPSVQSANVRRSLSSRSVQQFIPRPCVRSLHSLPGLYRVMRASRSVVTPFPWCCCSWPHSAPLQGGRGGTISPIFPKPMSLRGHQFQKLASKFPVEKWGKFEVSRGIQKIRYFLGSPCGAD